jgi:hypothetical protein
MLTGRVARALDTAVLLLHHDSKNGGYRGSTAIGASVDLMWHLESAADDPEPDRRRLRPGAPIRPLRGCGRPVAPRG